MITNQTSWEIARNKNLDYLKQFPKGFRPFDKGFFINFKQFFCHGNKLM